MSMYGESYAALEPGEGSGAKQSMKDECNVNLIVSRFEETGLISHIAEGVPQFVDAGELGDYRSIIEQVRKVDEYFAGLPAVVRTTFENDASAFMDFLESGATVEDLEALGLEAVFERRSARRKRRESDAEVEPVVEEPEAPGVPPVEAGTVPT